MNHNHPDSPFHMFPDVLCEGPSLKGQGATLTSSSEEI